jgi:pimeloyl-ACP methyl ester carboxylesterase
MNVQDSDRSINSKERLMKGLHRNYALLAILSLVLSRTILLPPVAVAQVPFTEEQGTFADGTQYRMRVPSNWNRTLINDLDYANNADSERNLYWLKRGYALSGTARHPLRGSQYDPSKEVSNLIKVLDLFEGRFGKPKRVVQHGGSGGGFVALLIAEQYPDRVDGVVAACAHVPVWLMNMRLDGWFVLKVLLAPHLTITNFPRDSVSMAAIISAWRRVVEDARGTPSGRARLALALTMGQWSVVRQDTSLRGPLTDDAAYREAMIVSVLDGVGRIDGPFYMSKLAGEAGWNTEVDYNKLFENGNELNKRAVYHLYREAGLNLEADLDSINAFPRVAPDPEKIRFWSSHGRTVTGDLQVPVLRTHTLGDLGVPVTLIEGYDARVLARGKADLYRTAFVDRSGHCTFSVGESTAALETLIRRLETGHWGKSTDPKQLNELATSFTMGDARFVEYKLNKFNRAWFPEQ